MEERVFKSVFEVLGMEVVAMHENDMVNTE